MANHHIKAPLNTLSAIQELITSLRSPGGCPWDRKQTPERMVRYLTEEVFEAYEAVISNDLTNACEELGDVLFQLLFIIFLYEESGDFTLSEVIERVCQKMIRRHPHVFGEISLSDEDQVKRQWIKIKESEKKSASASILDRVPKSLPPLLRAFCLSEAAAATGFDWRSTDEVMEKVYEEIRELNEAMDTERVEEELGDLLFTLTNVARFTGTDPHRALVRSIIKFSDRFLKMEMLAKEEGVEIKALSFDQLDSLWNRAKRV